MKIANLARRWLTIAAAVFGLIAPPAATQAQPASGFANAVASLAQHRSLAEQDVAMLKAYQPHDPQGRLLYAQAKAASDGFISGLEAGIDAGGGGRLTPALNQQLNEVASRSRDFEDHVHSVLSDSIRPGDKSAWDLLLPNLDKLIKSLTDSGLAIFEAASKAGDARRHEMRARLEQERWRDFGDIPPAR